MATKEQIWAAADAISNAGANPTLAAVRAYMGGGSYTDISAAMQSWRATQQASNTPIREPAPSAITEHLTSLGAEIWATALELANNRLQSEREALEAARQEAEETRKEAAALADAIAAELDATQAENARIAEQLAASATKQAEQQAIIAKLTTEATDNAHRAELAEVAQAEITRRAEQLTSLLDSVQSERVTEHNKALADATATAKQLTQAQKEAENARIAEQACQARLEASAREIEALKAQVKGERGEAKKSTELAAELRGRLAVFDEQAAKADKPAKAPRKPKQTN